MTKRVFSIAVTVVLLSLSLNNLTSGRALFDQSEMIPATQLFRTAADPPFVVLACHNVGQIGLSVTNQGHFGNGFADVGECIDGSPAPSAEYPIQSNIDYLFAGAFWIGAIIGKDTLVSVGADGWQPTEEMWPASFEQQAQSGELTTLRSISSLDQEEALLAKSEQDVIMVYYDTLTDGINDPIDGPHKPIGLKIKQTSYAWSYSYAESFVLFDYKITNINSRPLEKVYMGIYVDGDVGHPDDDDIHTDDICGFKLSVDQLQFENTECKFVDTINIAWIADNDGNNLPGGASSGAGKDEWLATDPTGVTGTRVVRTPSDSLQFSFNWWVSNTNASADFGPRLSGTDEEPFRDFGGFLGTPEGDKNKYYIMRHNEFDYDQLFSAVDQASSGWLPPFSQSSQVADGFDTRYLLSFGPFTIFPGEELPITFAYVAGKDFHVNPSDMADLYQSPLQPGPYAGALNFDSLGINAQWASWIYDNPGVDTDGDGFRGKARVCVNDSTMIDTTYDTFYAEDEVTIDSIVIRDIFFSDVDSIFYEGDGVPDFLGASPPPAPIVRLDPSPGAITVQWNGLRSETTPDAFSLEFDFEGYRVYVGLNNRLRDMVLESSYDILDFGWYVFDGLGSWKIAGEPLSLIELQNMFANGNRDYDPLSNGISNPIVHSDGKSYYFITQDWNRNDITDTTEIYKPYKYRFNFLQDGSLRLDSFGNPEPTPFPHTIILDSAFTFDTLLVDGNTGDTAWFDGGELTEDGKRFKYFEYAYELEDLLPSVQYFVSVTAFDFGAPASGLDALETSPLLNLVGDFPHSSSQSVLANDLGVIAYPNPYRIDGNYFEKGFEGRQNPAGLGVDKLMAVNFANLPSVCTIRIFTLDGDLVTEIEHNKSPDDPGSTYDKWSLITRNHQLAASGIYYWTVEEPNGKVQTGKLVLIM